MRLLAIGDPDNGCDYHRIIVPTLLATGFSKKKITNKFDEDVVKEGWDYILINRGIEFDVELLKKWREKYKFKLIIDNDDTWDLDPSHFLFEKYNNEGLKDKVINWIRLADLNIVTHNRLADKVSQINPNVIIRPNTIPYGWEQFKEDKIDADKVRIGWCGSITHLKDIELLRNPMKRLVGNKEIEVVIGGYNDTDEYSKEVWSRMVSAMSNSGRIPYKIIPAMQPHNYMSMYSMMDIVVIPLVSSTFNSYKSNLKVLEAASKKLPVIVSKVDPYLEFPDDTVLYVEQQSDWFKHINRLINNPEELKARGEALHNYCKKNYDLYEKGELRLPKI